MTAANDHNAAIVEEFRSNEGRVGGNFAGAPMVLVHSVGRRSGTQTVSPMMYLADPDDADVIYVFASAAGLPRNPAWYYNLTTAGTGSVEVGTDTYPVTVTELTGAERDRVYATQAERYPGFADYERKTAGIRTIPVLALRRSA